MKIFSLNTFIINILPVEALFDIEYGQKKIRRYRFFIIFPDGTEYHNEAADGDVVHFVATTFVITSYSCGILLKAVLEATKNTL